MRRIGTGTPVPGIVLVASCLLACSVDRSRQADPAEVPTASALGCADGRLVDWRDGAWACATPPDPGLALREADGAGLGPLEPEACLAA